MGQNLSSDKDNNPIKPKAAIYVRVSTEDQAKHGISLAAQEEALKNYCNALGYEIFDIYKDEGKSAKNIIQRPRMKQMLEDAQLRKFQAIFTYKLDRFSRSLMDLITTIEKLKEWGIDFVSLQDKIETTSASGKLMFHIISAFAEFERNVTSERTKFTMNKKFEDGDLITRAPLGYNAINKKLVPKEDSYIIQEIYQTFLNTDTSLTQLAKKYNLSVNGLKKVLSNETYLGKIKFAGKVVKGKHTPLISPELFEKVQKKLKGGIIFKGINKENY
ncbi:recombinase family protein [Patescibacteria group bacterium]|nr:recombinase family protein [Patescibacteria group bacterium]